ncbi:hypothetical protein CIHG_07920 [Coccidioides immitis H538.4]|uniref:Acyl-CoA dehydrogenase/oxidase N-terminal domain-containing protein n=1 Tax=Coccidioides immitis H538.4 TaxID=396776 RepID=A0A0J8RY68_COCIT|nr:hypothetical protein CIHG_07920 [Coccidioides immitis H538.4]
MASKLFSRSLLSVACRQLPASQQAARARGVQQLLSQTRAFSASSPTRIMDLSCFTPEQLMVRDAISKICSNFPDEYWAERDETGEYPHELHAALAKDGWIGIALPEELGGAGLGISEATMMLHTIAQSGAGLAGAQSIHANVYATQEYSLSPNLPRKNSDNRCYPN